MFVFARVSQTCMTRDSWLGLESPCTNYYNDSDSDSTLRTRCLWLGLDGKMPNIHYFKTVGRAPARQCGGRRFKSRSSKKMYPVSFPCGSLHYIYRKRVVSPYGASPYCLFPGCVVTWAWSLAKGQYMVSWLLTGAPPPRTKIMTK